MKTIQTEQEYESDLSELESLLNEHAAQNKQRAQELLDAIAEYEEKHYAMSPPTPLAAIIYHLESRRLRAIEWQFILGKLLEAIGRILGIK